MLIGWSHLEINVHNLALSLDLYTHGLGFELLQHEPGRAELQQGFFRIFLCETTLPVTPVTLYFEAPKLEASVSALIAQGCQLTLPVTPTDTQLQGSLTDPDGHILKLWRPLREDEGESLPPLPKKKSWAPEAEALMQALVAEIPEAFRKNGRLSATRMAEHLSSTSVSREQAILGYIRATPFREQAKQPLVHQGIDWQLYAKEFEPID